MAITLVHSASGTGNFGPSSFSTSVTVSAPASGNFVLCAVLGPNTSFATPTLTNATWTLLTSQPSQGDNYSCFLWYGVPSATGGTNLAVTSSSSGFTGYAVSVQYAEFSGVATSSEVDVYASNNQAGQVGTSFTCNTSNVSTTNANDLIVAFLTCCASGPPLSVSGGPTATEQIEVLSIDEEFQMMSGPTFTSINTVTDGGPVEIATQFAYYISTSNETYNVSQVFTDSTSVTAYCQSIIVAFAPPSAGGSTTSYQSIAIFPNLSVRVL